MSAWLTVVGMGEEGLAGLSPAARGAVERAEVLIGGARHLALVPKGKAERLAWRTPLKATMADIAERRGRRVVVLATGDPMQFGIGVTLSRHFKADEMTIMPGPSAFGLAAARLAWPLAEVATITLHGRDPALLHAHIAPRARLLVLSDDGATPALVAEALRARGYGPSRIVVFEHMGGPEERASEATAEAWTAGRVADLNTVAVECVAGAGAVVLPAAPGLADDLFATDGQLTKREVRAATVAALAPLPGQTLWDVGAGSGSVAIEWLRQARGGTAFAVERDAARCANIRRNAAYFGVPQLNIVAGQAPDALAPLPRPDTVFIGGGLATPGLFALCWQAVGSGGRLVANVVTLEGQAHVLDLHQRHGGSLVRIAVERAEPVGGLHGWRPLMPVMQWTAVKA